MSDWFETQFASALQKIRAEGRAKGRVEARSESVLRVLAVRGVQVDDTARQRILFCMDLDTLGHWLDRAVTATHISEVLEDLPQ